MKCKICEKEFNNYRQLNGHMSIHKNGPRYNNRKKKLEKIAFCVECDKRFAYYSKSSMGKFCSTTCSNNHRISNTNRLVEEGKAANNFQIRRYFYSIGKNKCFVCDQKDEWNGKKLVLQVDHIDGNSDNNLIINLRLLCPNCHSQTDTFTSRNRKNTKRNKYLRRYKKELVGHSGIEPDQSKNVNLSPSHLARDPKLTGI